MFLSDLRIFMAKKDKLSQYLYQINSQKYFIDQKF